ncbi:MAG: AAA family ATPase [Planctomycetota bacterium]|nr:AAA family ATPase [Planctomycetota bacterium]
MITKVSLKYFKRFEEQDFGLSDHIVLAGPNNSGKTTLLQAIMVWNLALQKWKGRVSPRPKAKKRVAIPVTRKEFTAIPLRAMNLLWHNAATALGKEAAGEKAGYPRTMKIALEGSEAEVPWELAFEIRFQSVEQIYIRPDESHVAGLPEAIERVNIVHVPPFSGIGVEETRYDRPYQDLLIGQGKPGDILRNLLLEVYQNKDPRDWNELSGTIREVFGYQLQLPQYHGLPYIVCEYLPGIPKGKGTNGLPRLDISSAGSGFHQVLTLLAFFYARPASVFLLDEPDAHQHIILQKQIYDLLLSVAAKRHCQLIISTHAEVLIDGTSPEYIMSFFGKPHRLRIDTQKDEVKEALKRLPATDLLLAEDSREALYVEGESDFNLLKAWAGVLDHPLEAWFSARPFWHSNQGRNPREARGHFFALRAIRGRIHGVLLLDGDNRKLPDREVAAENLTIIRWSRYEAESYLLHREALRRFVAERLELRVEAAMRFLEDQVPPAVLRDPLGTHDYLNSTPLSKTLLPGFFKAAGIQLSKNEYYQVAQQMKREEIATEVVEKLDTIAKAFGLVQ